MRIKTNGLILRETDVGENDKYIAILTENKGVINVILPNAKKIRNKNSGALQTFYYCELLLFESQRGYIVDDVKVKEGFEKLKYDIEKFSLAEYFCEITLVLSPSDGESRDFLRLILNSLYFLMLGTKSNHILKSIVELRTCVLSGYMPNLLGCIKCKEYKKEKFYFDIKNSFLVCDNCYKSTDNTYNLIPLDNSVLDAMRHIIYAKFDKLFSFKIPDIATEQLSNICEKYILKHTDYKFKSLDFWNSINNYELGL